MRKINLLFALLFSALISVAQETEQDKIDKDVWYNFMQAYQDKDPALFNKIHTDDVIRVVADAGVMFIGKEYKDKNLEVFNRWNSTNQKQKIEFSFLNRSQKDDWAHEIGIFKLTRFTASGENHLYGKFNVLHQKINGVWKIKIDSDTSEGETIGETDFQAGEILK